MPGWDEADDDDRVKAAVLMSSYAMMRRVLSRAARCEQRRGCEIFKCMLTYDKPEMQMMVRQSSLNLRHATHLCHGEPDEAACVGLINTRT
jgi:hypothetical protein